MSSCFLSLNTIIPLLFGPDKQLLDPESDAFKALHGVVLKALTIRGSGDRTGSDRQEEWNAIFEPRVVSQNTAAVLPAAVLKDRPQSSVPDRGDIGEPALPPVQTIAAIDATTTVRATAQAPGNFASRDPERAAAEPLSSDGLKNALVFAVHFVFAAGEIGGTVGIWNLLRSQGGAEGPDRETSEWFAAIVAGLTFPMVGLLFKKLRKSLAGVIVLNPDVSHMVEGMEWIIGSLLAAAELHAGIETGSAASRAFSDGDSLPEWMFLGYVLTFGLMAVTDVLVARVLRGPIAIDRGADASSPPPVLDELESLIRDLGEIIASPPEDASWYQTLGTSMASLSGFVFSLSRFLNSGVWQIGGYRAYQAYTSRIVPTQAGALEYNLKLWSADVIFFLSFRALMWMGGRVPKTEWSDVWKGLKFLYHCRGIDRGHALGS